mmetsp:Transcript_13956/g.15899  ORF Transcript_13956/g.15899 Transcript_13956/m.15899 type:complete len:175 (-) Transcript_13956:106-630(-)
MRDRRTLEPNSSSLLVEEEQESIIQALQDDFELNSVAWRNISSVLGIILIAVEFIIFLSISFRVQGSLLVVVSYVVTAIMSWLRLSPRMALDSKLNSNLSSVLLAAASFLPLAVYVLEKYDLNQSKEIIFDENVLHMLLPFLYYLFTLYINRVRSESHKDIKKLIGLKYKLKGA